MNDKLKEIDIKIKKLEEEYNKAGVEMEKAKKKFVDIGKLLMELKLEEKKIIELQK